MFVPLTICYDKVEKAMWMAVKILVGYENAQLGWSENYYSGTQSHWGSELGNVGVVATVPAVAVATERLFACWDFLKMREIEKVIGIEFGPVEIEFEPVEIDFGIVVQGKYGNHDFVLAARN